MPDTLKLLRSRIAALEHYSAEGAEQARQAASQIFFLQNSLKAEEGARGLLDKKSWPRSRPRRDRIQSHA